MKTNFKRGHWQDVPNPNGKWLSVCTPSIFREIYVRDIENPSATEKRLIERLQDIAAAHRTTVEITPHRRG
jgi:hypothetical protein